MHFNLLHFALFNTRSLNELAMFLKDYVVENRIALLAIAQTWLELNNQQMV